LKVAFNTINQTKKQIKAYHNVLERNIVRP